MTRSRLLLAALLLGPALAGCGAAARPEPLPAPAPEVVLTAEDRDAWRAPAPSAGEVPVLLYHGLGGREACASRADAYYGLERDDFAKQLALLDHAGYEAITLAQFRAFHAGDEVALPDHPVLLTFDDAREDAWLGADAVLARHGWSAVMFVDVGAVAAGGEEYASWDQLRAMDRSGRWELQLHAGRGHRNIPSAPGTDGPFYANRDTSAGETLEGWRTRVREDLDWGEEQMREHRRARAGRDQRPGDPGRACRRAAPTLRARLRAGRPTRRAAARRPRTAPAAHARDGGRRPARLARRGLTATVRAR